MTGRARRFVARAAIVGATMLMAFDASAEPTAEERAIARSLFDEGRQLAKDGKWTEACAKLEASERTAPGIGTLFNLGDCYEHLGKTASAWSAFSEAADMAKRAGQPDRESIARDRAGSLAPKLAKMRLDMKRAPPPGFELRLDGKPLPAGVIGAEIPVDPGDHKVTVSSPVISKDGLTLYFGSDAAVPGFAGTNVWTAKRASTGADFGAPTPLNSVNSSSAEQPTWVSPDECRLYLASNRPGAGKQDVWVASRPK